MKKFFKDHLFQLIYLIPVSFIAIGSFVLNIYLNQFGIIDVALFDSRTVFVGFITVLQLVFFFVVFCVFIGNLNTFHGIISLIISVFWKPILFSIIVYMYSGNLDNIERIYTDWRYNLINSMVLFSILSFLYLFFIRDSFNNWKTKDKGDKFIAWFSISTTIISSYIVFYFLCKDNVFKEIYKSYMYFSLTCVPYCFAVFWKKFPFISPEENNSLFQQNEKPVKFDYFFVILYLLLAFMISLTFYSKQVFPYIPNNMGGGYYKCNAIILNDERILEGKLIHSNKDYLYMNGEEGKIQQIPVSEIKEYIIPEKKQKEKRKIDFRKNTKKAFSKIEINLIKELKKMESLISAIIAAVISAIVSIFITTLSNNFSQKKDLDNQLDSILKLAFDHPELETISETKKWKDVDKTSIESQRYELYATMVFNYLERVCIFYKYKTRKIEKYLDVKSWVRIHKEYWEHPTVEHENQDVYEKKFTNIINEYLK